MNRLFLIVAAMSAAGCCRAQLAGAPPTWTYDAIYTVDAFAVQRGSSRGTVALDRAEVSIDYDGTGHDLPWLTARVDLGHMNGTRISDRAGDVQGLSNIEGPRAFRAFNVWVAATRGQFGAKVGVIDLNSEFDTQDVAAVFLNGSHGTGADLSHSGRNGPSIFPNMGPGAVGSFTSSSNVVAKFGVFDGTPNDPDRPRANSLHLDRRDGALLVASVERRFFVDTRLAAGAWAYSYRLPTQVDATPGPRWASRGGWAIVETPLVRGRGDEPRAQGWLRAGSGNARYDPVRSYIGGGVVWRGLTRQQPRDSLGIAIARAGLARGAYADPADGTSPPRSHETTLELTYRRRWGDLLTLQPDLQYVAHPTGRSGHALGIGLRISVEKGNQSL